MSQTSTLRKGFTLIELLVVISIIALLLGILVPVLGIAKKNANMMKEGVNLRNIHAGLVTYGTGNKDWFTGYTAAGKIQGWDAATSATANYIGKYYAANTNATSATAATTATADTTAYAQAVLMDEGVTTPAQWLSTGETSVTGGNAAVVSTNGTVYEAQTNKTSTAAPATDADTHGYVSVFNSSYAVLGYGSGTLKAEWKSNQNQQAAVLATRMLGAAATKFESSATASFNTVWTDFGSGSFKGSVVRGDSSTSNEPFKRNDAATPFSTLKYGSVTGTVPATATAGNVVGPFGGVAVAATTGAGSGAATYGTSAGNVGAGVTTGAFVTGEIVSALN